EEKKNVFLGYDLDDPEQFQSFENYLWNQVDEGVSLKEALQFSPELLEYIYSVAYSFYQQSNFSKSITLFQFLILLDPMDYRYQFGIAANMQMSGDFISAVNHYAIAAKIEDKTPSPAYYAGECYLKIDDIDSAVLAFEEVVKKSGKKKKFFEIKERSSLILKNLRSLLEEGSSVSEKKTKKHKSRKKKKR
ncbi:SycD/LcrH family type III secretion system chaperone, partial [Simkania negevensis]|nr:SycD/LcrH family type III secretion system chaperone [Simkania negevensis]